MGMIGVKTGTKTWNEKPRDIIQKSSGVENISATDKDKLNGQNVGDVLNQISDPNYVDPSKKMRTVGNDKLDKDAFMKLMLAQMRNQDPTNPLKSHEMAAQLAQFSSVEQMMNMNTTLTDMKNGQKPAESFQALNFIGKAVSGDSAKLFRVKGDINHDVGYQLAQDAESLTVKVRNQDGDIIRTQEMKNLRAGPNSWRWNGATDRGNQAPVGEYSFIIEGKNKDGKKLAVKTDFQGLISGVTYSSEGPVLMVGSQRVKLKDVKKIEDPSLLKENQKMNAPPTAVPQVADQAAADESQGAQEAPVEKGASQIFNQVGLSRELMSKLEKETKPDSKENSPAEANQLAAINSSSNYEEGTLRKVLVQPQAPAPSVSGEGDGVKK